MTLRRIHPFLMAAGLLGLAALVLMGVAPDGLAASEQFKGQIFAVGKLKPIDSASTLKVGDPAPDFSLPSTSGETVTLSQFQGKKNVVLTFVPAAWTPVCSEQWPGYNVVREQLEKNDTIVLGITVDNVPTLFAWTQQMGGLWFPVLSDFWPHGAVASKYGILRSTGVSERALFVVDKKGVLRYIDIHDINERPKLEELMGALQGLKD